MLTHRLFVHAARIALGTLALFSAASSDELGAQAPQAAATPAPVTLAIINARVWTGNPAQPWAEAVAVTGDRIAIVGTSADVKAQTPAAARTIDAKGALVTPGFIDFSYHHRRRGGVRNPEPVDADEFRPWPTE